MKGRSVRLREVHKSGGGAVCSIVWAGDRLATASSADPVVLIHSCEQQLQSLPPKALCHHRDGVTALALSPAAGTGASSLASGSIDHSVKLYSFPDAEFQTNITRFTLPIRCLAFNKSGSLLAAAGDDDGIKLVATMDNSISKILKGHTGPVTCLSFDPMNEFLASIDAFGTAIYWELSSGKSIHTLKAVAPYCGSDKSLINVLSWSPDGETLAVPGLKNDVVMYDRDTAEKLHTLKGDHERPICFLSWSPNGKYIATSGLDNQVLIWEVNKRLDIERHKFEDRISSLSWKPNGNALAVIDVKGKFGVWESPVPSSMISPTDGAPVLQKKKLDGHLLFDEEEEEQLPTSGSLDEHGAESLDESAPVSRKRLRKNSAIADSSDEDIDGEEGLIRQIESHKKYPARREKKVTEKEGSVNCTKFSRTKLQEAFQPGSTPVQAGKRRFLSYNMLGSITTLDNNGYSHIEVDFHDTGRGPRVPAMTDYFGFTMASMNENGSIFACPCKDEKHTSTLMYRPFSSWASNSEWSMRFEAEEVKAVALGTGWVAAVTSLNYLRIFSDSGLQKHILRLKGPVVTAVGFREKLAIVSHTSDCLPSGDQMLEVNVFNIIEGTRSSACPLPMTPGSSVAWFGFSEDGRLSAYDSMGVLSVFSNQFGGSWLPIFSASKARKSEEENYWVVGLNASELFCVVCKSPDSYPSVTPKPVHTRLGFSFPLACSDLDAADLENEFMMCNLRLSEAQKKIEEMTEAGMDSTQLDDEIFEIEKTLDRCILRLIASCCNGDKLWRSTDLARLLSFEKSVKAAIKLATALKQPNLAERFDGILEERLRDPNETIAVPSTTSKLTSIKSSFANEIYKSSEPLTTHSAKSLYHPKEWQDDMKDSQVSTSLQNAASLNVTGTIDNSEEKTKVKLAEAPSSCRNSNDMSSNNGKPHPRTCTSQENVTGSPLPAIPFAKVTNGSSSRPVNPFAKTPNNQNKSTLLDTLKKMKADGAKNPKALQKSISFKN